MSPIQLCSVTHVLLNHSTSNSFTWQWNAKLYFRRFFWLFILYINLFSIIEFLCITFFETFGKSSAKKSEIEDNSQPQNSRLNVNANKNKYLWHLPPKKEKDYEICKSTCFQTGFVFSWRTSNSSGNIFESLLKLV